MKLVDDFAAGRYDFRSPPSSVWHSSLVIFRSIVGGDPPRRIVVWVAGRWVRMSVSILAAVPGNGLQACHCPFSSSPCFAVKAVVLR